MYESAIALVVVVFFQELIFLVFSSAEFSEVDKNRNIMALDLCVFQSNFLGFIVLNFFGT